ncbi:hypothetical protein DPH57_09635 [Massilia sp. YMA4]|nr:hypothetical protein DPH57_09635 [Massilia sp. YMA4]
MTGIIGLEEKTIFSDPHHLAAWVNKYFLVDICLERDRQLLPVAEICKLLDLTAEQLEPCAREYALLRIAGVASFIKSAYDDVFWSRFHIDIVRLLTKKLCELESQEQSNEISMVLDRYVQCMVLKQWDECSEIYLLRIFENRELVTRMSKTGIGDIAADEIINAYSIMQDAFMIALHP